jgi:hypothetical protein
MKTARARLLALSLAAMLVFAGSAAAQEKPKDPPKEAPKEAAKIDVTGTWDLAVETQQGTMTLSSTFKQDGEKLTGTQTSQMGETALEGTIKGTDIAFAIVFNMQGQDITITYTGKVDGDTMSGAIEFGTFGSSTWAGKKRK